MRAPPRSDDRRRMPDTPAWVRDAVFYQIFPDRFAGSARVPKPGPLEPWDAPPTNYGFKGGDLLGIVEHLDHIESLGRQRAVPDAGLPVGLEPPLPHVRLPRGRPAARRRRGAPRAPRRGPRAGHAGHPRRRLQPHRPRVLAVPPRPRDRAPARRTGTGSTSTRRRSTHGRPIDAYPVGPAAQRRRAGRAACPGEPERDVDGDTAPRAGSATRRWWGMPGAARSSTSPSPAVREYLWGVAEHWLRFGIDGWRLDVPAEIDDPRVLGGVPAPLPGDQPRGLPRGRDLARRARVARRRPLRRADELPARRGDHRLRRRARRSTSRSCAPTTSTARSTRLDGAGFAARLGELLARVRAGDERRPAEPPRQPRHAAGPARSSAAIARRWSWRCCSRRRCPARRAPTTATRSGVMGGIDPDYAARLPVGRVALGPRAARRRSARRSPCGAPSRRCARTASTVIGRVGVGAGVSSARTATGASPSRSTPATSAVAGAAADAGRRRRRRVVDRCSRPGAPERAPPPLARRRTARRSSCRRAPGPSSGWAEPARPRSRRSPAPVRRGAEPILPRCPTSRWRCRASSSRRSSPPSIRRQARRRARRPRARSPIATSLVVDAADGPVVDGLARRRAARHHARPTSRARCGSTPPTPRPTSSSACGPRSAASTRRRSPRSIASSGPAAATSSSTTTVATTSRASTATAPSTAPGATALGPFLTGGFRVRVVHCFWEFESPGGGDRLPDASAFGEAGAAVAATLKRPRLSYNVAVYHRSRP